MRPTRHRHRLPMPESFQTVFEHPLRFSLFGRDQPHHLLVQTFRDHFGLDVGREAVFVFGTGQFRPISYPVLPCDFPSLAFRNGTPVRTSAPPQLPAFHPKLWFTKVIFQPLSCKILSKIKKSAPKSALFEKISRPVTASTAAIRCISCNCPYLRGFRRAGGNRGSSAIRPC